METVVVTDLGLSPYRQVWDQQESLFQEAQTRKLAGQRVTPRVLLVEHPHVYTLGKSGVAENLLISTVQLHNAHAEFIKVNRGGDITYHGPGQLVVYPIIDLESFSLGVKEYIHKLEEVVINALAEYGIKGERMEGATGVWLDVMGSNPRKICAIGVKCSRYITMHGFALNVNTDLTYFNYINPCGFVDKGVTSIQKEIHREIPMNLLKENILKQFANCFGSKINYNVIAE